MPCAEYSSLMFSSSGRRLSSIIGLCLRISASAGMRAEAKITGRGDLPGHSRVVSDGLSEIIVLVPARIASAIARSRCISTDVSGFDSFTGIPPPWAFMAAI